jgi:hypothetical protein
MNLIGEQRRTVMKRRNLISAVLLLVLLAFPGSAAVGKAGADERGGSTGTASPSAMSWRLYAVHYLDMRQAGLMLEERLPEMLRERQFEMKFEGIGGKRQGDGKPEGYLRILTSEATHERISEILAEADQPPATRLFHIVVLQSTDDPADQPDLSPNAQDALHDLQSMLRFKGYRVIDSAMIRSSGHSDVSLGSNYAIEFWFHVGPSKEKPLQVEQLLLYSQIENAPRHMETAFSMAIGETVVVGTSRPFNEDQALVVLLTAVE